MPAWKKVITSGSDAELNKLVVDTHVTASAISVNGNSVLTTENYDTRVCHLKTNINASIAQGSGTAFDVNFNIEEHTDSSLFSHSSGVITVLSTGWYHIYANMVYDNAIGDGRNTIRAYVSINGSEITSTATYDYDRGASYGKFSNNKIETMLYLNTNDTIAISNYAYNEDGAVTIESAECEFIVNSVAVQTSADNADTVDGLHGSQFVRSDIDASLTGSFTGSFFGDGSGLTGIAGGGSSVWYDGTTYITSSADVQITGSLNIYKSGSTVFNIEGSQGTLFTVTDELSGSLFSVNDISGIPIFEVFSDDTVKIGTYSAEGIEVQGSDVKITGSLAVGNIAPNATDGRIDASNDIVAYSSSDKRWKTNIKLIESPLEKLQKLSGVEFDWIEDFRAHGNSGNDVGVIAQEVELVLPQAVQIRDTGMKAVRYEKLIPLLIETVKEQQKQIDELKNKIG